MLQIFKRTKQHTLCLTLAVAASTSCTLNPVFADNKSDLSDAVYDYSKCYWQQYIVQRMMNFKLSPAIWTKMLDKENWGVKTTSNFASAIGEYAKKNGWGDFEGAESANNNDRENNKAKVSEMVDSIKGKIDFTLVADGIKGTDAEWDLVHRYMGTLSEFIEKWNWKAKSGQAFFTLTVRPAKDVSVSADPDGKHFNIVMPSDHEVEEWDSKMTKGLEKALR